MKKIFSLLILSVIAGLVVAPVALAQEPVPSPATSCTMRHNLTGGDWTDRGFTCVAKAAACDFNNTAYTCGSCCTMDTIYTVSDWFFVGAVVFSIVMTIWGAFDLMLSAGDPEKVKGGRDRVLFAAIGMAVALLAKAIPGIARSLVRI